MGRRGGAAPHTPEPPMFAALARFFAPRPAPAFDPRDRADLWLAAAGH